MRILVTGGAGYIGSHTCVELLNDGYDVAVVDNLVNSSKKAIDRVMRIAGKKLDFYEADIRDKKALDGIFSAGDISCVIHFAGLKAVGESVEKPYEYYENNIGGTLTLLGAMRRANVKRIIFSSSATVYGEPEKVPVSEDAPKGFCTNPYGWTKWMIEQILADIAAADPKWKVALLRYFNPIGADKSGLIGEDPKGIPNNLVPYIAQTAVGRREYLRVFGGDYDTPDGTGIRDYIHVTDLARGHVLALEHMDEQKGTEVFNLGTGKGYSVLEVLHAYEKACGHEIPYKILPRRAGDTAMLYCVPDKAAKVLGFKAEYGIEEMCRDSWKWQSENPYGYGKE